MYMYEVVKCPNHGGSESLRMLRHYREPMSEPSPRNINYYKKKSERTALSQLALSIIGLSELRPIVLPNLKMHLTPPFLFLKKIEDIKTRQRKKEKKERNTYMHIQFKYAYTRL